VVRIVLADAATEAVYRAALAAAQAQDGS
jgi:hypothetical protein